MRLTTFFALAAACSAQVLDIGSRRELFVDHYLLQDLKGARLELQKPVDRGTVVKYDKPWEGAFSNYSTIIQDGPRYRLYYRGLLLRFQPVSRQAAGRSRRGALQSSRRHDAHGSGGVRFRRRPALAQAA